MTRYRVFATAFATVLASPAWAGSVTPGPEAGIGLGAMALVGAGYVALRRWMGRR